MWKIKKIVKFVQTKKMSYKKAFAPIMAEGL